MSAPTELYEARDAAFMESIRIKASIVDGTYEGSLAATLESLQMATAVSMELMEKVQNYEEPVEQKSFWKNLFNK